MEIFKTPKINTWIQTDPINNNITIITKLF